VTSDKTSNRVTRGVTRGEPFTFLLDDQPMEAYPGETVAAALLGAGIRILRRTDKAGAPRGMFCGMGLCFDCLVTVDGRPHLRACLTPVTPGMHVTTQDEAAWRAGRA
jgi:NADH dehydrogenase/NADH:ubiquinone oxidoreductase subunit G